MKPANTTHLSLSEATTRKLAALRRGDMAEYRRLQVLIKQLDTRYQNPGRHCYVRPIRTA